MRGSVSLLSLFILSANAPIGLNAFPLPKLCPPTAAAAAQNDAKTAVVAGGLNMKSSLQRQPVPGEDRLHIKGLSGDERAHLAESIAKEFRVQLAGVKAACDAQHKLDLAQQRVELLRGMVPLAAHEAIVDSLAGAVPRQQEAAEAASVRQRDTSSHRASAKIRGMSDSLARLKRDVASLRRALGSHDESRRALAAEIRANEVEPQRLRAEAAENDLSELRQATHSWLATAHSMKLEAAAEAQKSGYADGYAVGRAELQAERASFSEQLARSRLEVAEARSEAVDLVAAAGAAGAAALAKSRNVWRAKGRAEGIAEALTEAGAGDRERFDSQELREVFAAYVVSAHEQKLSAVAAEKDASQERIRELSRDLTNTKNMLATVLKERISELELRRDSALAQVSRGSSEGADSSADVTATDRPPLDVDLPDLTGGSPWTGSAGAAAAGVAAAAAVKLATTSPFWQECGGGGQ